MQNSEKLEWKIKPVYKQDIHDIVFTIKNDIARRS